MTVENGCAVYVPTLREKLFRWLGYRYHLGEEPEGTEALEGWMRTDMRIHFDWRDRVLLLLTGKLSISSIASFDAPSPSIVKTRMDWQIIEPGVSTTLDKG